jgi:hypothetical protein
VSRRENKNYTVLSLDLRDINIWNKNERIFMVGSAHSRFKWVPSKNTQDSPLRIIIDSLFSI